MARLFDDGSTEYLNIEQAVLVAKPLAMVAWFNTNDMEAWQTLISLNDKDVANQVLRLHLDKDDDAVWADEITSTAREYAVATSSYLVNTWGHAAALFVSATDRRAFFNGGSKGTNVDAASVADLDRTSIGKTGNAAGAAYMSGLIAEAAIYDLSQWPGATDGDKADNFEKILPSLAKIYTPKHYPLGRVAYWDLVRSLNDINGGYNLTASGTVIAAHPRIIQPHLPL